MRTPATKPTRLNWAPALVCAVAAVVMFQFFGSAAKGYVRSDSLFWWWSSQWIDPQAETEHGWLILALSVWLFWRNLRTADGGARIADYRKPETVVRIPVSTETAADRLVEVASDNAARQSEIRDPKSAINRPAWPALVALLTSLALHAVGFAAQQARISILALLLFTWGVLRLAGGRRWGAAAAFPLAFMVFAIPISALDSIGFWLRVWVVNASGAIAQAFGIGVLKSGTQLVAPDGSYNYDVAAACSGIRSLTAMTALSLLAGYLEFRSWWRRGLVLGLCFPLVYIGNVARIIAIIFAAHLGGPKWGDIAHAVMGYGVFAIVLGGVLGAIALLRRLAPEAPKTQGHVLSDTRIDPLTANAEEKHHLIDDTVPGRARVRGWKIATMVVALAVGEMGFLYYLGHLPPRGRAGVALAANGLNPVDLPAFIGTEWIGRREEVSVVEREILPADTGFSRKTYIALHDSRQRVFLSIVLSGRDRTSIHRPELCLVGQGWTIVDSTPHVFRSSIPRAANFEATIMRVIREVQVPGAAGRPAGKMAVPQLVAYWFVASDAIVATHWQRMLHDGWNRIAHARADRWAYVLMQTDATDGEAAALGRMQAVLDATLPVFLVQ